MPVNPHPGGQPTERPAKEPLPKVSEEGGHDARDEEDSKDALANRELDEQTTLARPPLGN